MPVVKIVDLLARRGVVVPERTLHRFCAEELGYRRQRSTVPVVDGEPGGEVQVDFGHLGYLTSVDGRRRLVRALIFTAVYSRHMFVWLCHRDTLEEVIAGCEAAWAFFGGVFHVMVTEYVPRNIFVVLCPPGLCGRDRWRAAATGVSDGGGLLGGA